MCHVARRDIELRTAVETHENLTRSASNLAKILQGYVGIVDLNHEGMDEYARHLDTVLDATKSKTQALEAHIALFFDRVQEHTRQFEQTMATSRDDMVEAQRSHLAEHAGQIATYNQVRRFSMHVAQLLTANSNSVRTLRAVSQRSHHNSTTSEDS